MDFFSDCQNETQTKEVYRKLSKHFHPDKGGDSALQVELQKQYDNWNPGQSNRVQATGNFQTSLAREEYQSSFGAAYNYNPRVEILESEIRKLKSMLNDSPDIIANLTSRIEWYRKNQIEVGDELESIIEKVKALEDENINLKYKIVSLQNEHVQECPQTLWDKIKFVMGNKAVKDYN